MIRLLAERSDTKSNVKLDGFRSQFHASYVSSHTEKLWYNETVCLWMTIYIYCRRVYAVFCWIYATLKSALNKYLSRYISSLKKVWFYQNCTILTRNTVWKTGFVKRCLGEWVSEYFPLGFGYPWRGCFKNGFGSWITNEQGRKWKMKIQREQTEILIKNERKKKIRWIGKNQKGRGKENVWNKEKSFERE